MRGRAGSGADNAMFEATPIHAGAVRNSRLPVSTLSGNFLSNSVLQGEEADMPNLVQDEQVCDRRLLVIK